MGCQVEKCNTHVHKFLESQCCALLIARKIILLLITNDYYIW